MTNRDIRGLLRRLTAEKMIFAWTFTGTGADLRYTVCPNGGGAIIFTQEEAATYCAMVQHADLEPLYRESEPDWLDMELAMPASSEEPS